MSRKMGQNWIFPSPSVWEYEHDWSSCPLYSEFTHSDVSHHTSLPSCSWLIMDLPDGKWSYFAKPVAAEAAKLKLREHFPSILKYLVSKPAVLLSVSMFGSGFLWSVENGGKADLQLIFKRNTAVISSYFMLFKTAERSLNRSEALKAWETAHKSRKSCDFWSEPNISNWQQWWNHKEKEKTKTK